MTKAISQSPRVPNEHEKDELVAWLPEHQATDRDLACHTVDVASVAVFEDYVTGGPGLRWETYDGRLGWLTGPA